MACLECPRKSQTFEGLLDLLKEGLDSPATLVEVTDTGRCLIEILGKEDHDNPFTVEFDPCLNPAKALRILSFGDGTNQGNLVITDYVPGRFAQSLATNMVAEVVLGAGMVVESTASIARLNRCGNPR